MSDLSKDYGYTIVSAIKSLTYKHENRSELN